MCRRLNASTAVSSPGFIPKIISYRFDACSHLRPWPGQRYLNFGHFFRLTAALCSSAAMSVFGAEPRCIFQTVGVHDKEFVKPGNLAQAQK